MSNIRQPYRALVYTILALIVFLLAEKIPWPLVSGKTLHYAGESGIPASTVFRQTFMSFGFISLMTGFILVEILSFFVPPFKHWRTDGLEGRQRLNRCATWLALGLVFLYSSQIINQMQNFRGPDATPMMGPITFGDYFLSFGFFTLGLGVLLLLVRFISRHGIGNGYGIFCLMGILSTIPQNIINTFNNGNLPEHLAQFKDVLPTEPPPNFVGVIFFIVIIGLLVKYSRSTVLQGQVDNKPIRFEMPTFPQGLFVFSWTANIQALLMTNAFNQGYGRELVNHYSWNSPISFAGILLGMSFIGYYLICYPQRVSNNTFGKITFESDWTEKIQKGAIRGTVIITFAWFFMNMPNPIEEQGTLIPRFIPLIHLIIGYAIARDLFLEFRFLKKAENHHVLGEFDNVHYVAYLKGLFESEKISFVLQGYEYRRLWFFMDPLFKIKILVDEKDLTRAQELADLENVPVV